MGYATASTCRPCCFPSRSCCAPQALVAVDTWLPGSGFSSEASPVLDRAFEDSDECVDERCCFGVGCSACRPRTNVLTCMVLGTTVGTLKANTK